MSEAKSSGGRQRDSVRGRRFNVEIPLDALVGIQNGSLKTTYKGLLMTKNPFDLVLYLRVIEQLRPRTIIEVGSWKGGSALWFRDQGHIFGLEAEIISIDIHPPTQSFSGVTFCAGDVYDTQTFPHDLIRSAPRPWLVIDDSPHTYESVRSMLAYFGDLLQSGDRLVVEDGVVADLPADQYGQYEDGPNRAVAEFLDAHSEYEIDVETCDFYGHNVTWCPNAWLIRT